MKKYFLFACVAAALVSCSSDEFLGENPELTQKTENDGAIIFKATQPKAQRADIVGADAATKLGNNFVVYGTKHSAAENNTADNDELVFNQYDVKYTANSAGTAEDNSHNWAYVNNNSYVTNSEGNAITQSIKYWDYSAANGYTFYAFSSPDISYPAASGDKVAVTKTTAYSNVVEEVEKGTKYDKGYTLTVKNGANLDNLYFADRKEVAKTNYKDPVVFTFRNFGAKVRVGFYETISGYSVKIDKFYFDNDATAAVTTYKAMDKVSTTSFKAALQNVKADATSNNVTVTYYDNTTGIENRAKVTNTTVEYNYDLTLGEKITAATTLGTTSSAPTWDKADGAYTTVYPFEANTNPMLVRVDYTLTSEDGSGETIEVKNARAIVPVQYVQWKSNTAYTYLFKISNNTNGTTGTIPTDPDNPGGGDPTPDPEGLFPITFDAVVVNATDTNQETITTFTTNSVTTYAKNSDVTVNGEYKAGTVVYFVAEDQSTHKPIVPTGVGTQDGKAKVYKIEGDNAAKATEANVIAFLSGLPVEKMTLTPKTDETLVAKVPANDGTEYDFGAKVALKSKLGTTGKYAYVYTTTKYVEPNYDSVGSEEYSSSTTYYFKTSDDVYSAASGLSADNWDTYKASLYKMTSAGTPGVYTVKVITVQ